MEVIAAIVKAVLIPGSLWFLIVGLCFGVTLLYGRDAMARMGRRWLTGLLGLYFVLSLPLVSDWLGKGLSREYGSLARPSDAGAVNVVVALGQGAVTFRLGEHEITQFTPRGAFCALEAARVYRLLDNPLVVASGGIPNPAMRRTPESEIMRAALMRLGVPAERIVLESDSQNTREQVTNVVRLLRERGIDRFVLVTSPEHMRRAMEVFAANGLHPTASVSPVGSVKSPLARWRVLPSIDALGESQKAIYEYLAIIHYWIRNWL